MTQTIISFPKRSGGPVRGLPGAVIPWRVREPAARPDDALIARCVNPGGIDTLSGAELSAFHDLIRTRVDYNRVHQIDGFRQLSRRQQDQILDALRDGPFEDLDNLNSTGSAVFGDNGRDAFAFTIFGSDRHDIRPWLSHRPYCTFTHFILSVSLL